MIASALTGALQRCVEEISKWLEFACVGLFGDDGFSFGNSFGGSLLVGVMAFFPDAGGSVIQSLALSTIPFDISLFPENNRIIRGLDYDATLEALTLASPVPELATWAMMVLGFAGIGFMSCRRTRLA